MSENGLNRLVPIVSTNPPARAPPPTPNSSASCAVWNADTKPNAAPAAAANPAPSVVAAVPPTPAMPTRAPIAATDPAPLIIAAPPRATAPPNPVNCPTPSTAAIDAPRMRATFNASCAAVAATVAVLNSRMAFSMPNNSLVPPTVRSMVPCMVSKASCTFCSSVSPVSPKNTKPRASFITLSDVSPNVCRISRPAP